jgi:hypothetical protein
MFILPRSDFRNAITPFRKITEKRSIRGGKQNMAGVPEIHHALRYIYTTAAQIGFSRDIGVPGDSSGMKTHAHRQIGAVSERPRDLDSALYRSERITKKSEDDAVTRGSNDEFAIGFGTLHLCGGTNYRCKIGEKARLDFMRLAGIADDIQKKHMGDLSGMRFGRRRHESRSPLLCSEVVQVGSLFIIKQF